MNLRTSAFKWLSHLNNTFHFPPLLRLKLAKKDVEISFLNKFRILRSNFWNLIEYWHPFSGHPSGSHRSLLNNIKIFINFKTIFWIIVWFFFDFARPVPKWTPMSSHERQMAVYEYVLIEINIKLMQYSLQRPYCFWFPLQTYRFQLLLFAVTRRRGRNRVPPSTT